jgi:hypothetical protein
MDGTKALVQDSVKTDDIEDLLSGKTVNVKLENPLKDNLSYCAINTYEGFDMKTFSGSEKKITKNIVFLDISKSAGSDKKVKKRYQELIDTWKNNGAALDIYTFNTAVTSAGYDLSDIEFWGNTDMGIVISYIQNNNLENANIVILTDADSYERAGAEDKTIDYKKLKSNRISLIQIGDKIRTLKTEVTKSILASEGDVMRLAPKASLDEGIKSIFSPKQAPATCESYTGNNTGALSAIEGSRDGKLVIGSASSYTGTIVTEKAFYSSNKNLTPSIEALGSAGKWWFLIQTVIDDSILKGKEYELAWTYNYVSGSVFPSWYTPEEWLLTFDYTGKSLIFQIYKNGELIQEERKFLTQDDLDAIWKKTFFDTREWLIQINDSNLLEKIGKKAHIVNQSMSLIALENDQQRRDLERYSNQEDKYDTNYQNFDNTSTNNAPRWEGRREAVTFGLDSTSIWDSIPRSPSRWADSMFSLSSKSTSTMSINSSSAGMNITGGVGGTPLMRWWRRSWLTPVCRDHHLLSCDSMVRPQEEKTKTRRRSKKRRRKANVENFSKNLPRSGRFFWANFRISCNLE